MKNKITCYYNELGYRVHNITTNKELYTAGNSPFDSQCYVSVVDGVGLEAIKQYCEQTTKDIAKENNAKYAGIEYEGMEV